MEPNQPSAELLYQLIGVLYTETQMSKQHFIQLQNNIQSTQRQLEEFTSKYHLQTKKVGELMKELENCKVCTCKDKNNSLIDNELSNKTKSNTKTSE